jgi:hypothetical protein
VVAIFFMPEKNGGSFEVFWGNLIIVIGFILNVQFAFSL